LAPHATDLPWLPAVAVETVTLPFSFAILLTAKAPPSALNDLRLNLLSSSL
jgi:hypothetical protein